MLECARELCPAGCSATTGHSPTQYLASVNQSPRTPTTEVGMECPPGPVELLGAHNPDRKPRPRVSGSRRPLTHWLGERALRAAVPPRLAYGGTPSTTGPSLLDQGFPCIARYLASYLVQSLNYPRQAPEGRRRRAEVPTHIASQSAREIAAELRAGKDLAQIFAYCGSRTL